MYFILQLLAQYFAKEEQQLGGPGIIVKILDEAKISKRIYNKGRILKGQWVFGGIERNGG